MLGLCDWWDTELQQSLFAELRVNDSHHRVEDVCVLLVFSWWGRADMLPHDPCDLEQSSPPRGSRFLSRKLRNCWRQLQHAMVVGCRWVRCCVPNLIDGFCLSLAFNVAMAHLLVS